jgi:ribonuclease R
VTLMDGAEEESAFVAPPDLDGLLDSDWVSGTVIEDKSGLRMRAPELVERRRRQLFGQVVKSGAKRLLAVDPEVGNSNWPLIGGRSVEVGSWVVGTIERDRVRVQRTVKAADASLERVIARYDLATEYPEAPAPRPLSKAQRAQRRDLRSMATLTIDAPYSRDLDDAIAALPADPEGGVRVLVSIADVDALIPEDSPLDREARERATSVYLAGRVLPMLPPQHSEDTLSLLPNVDRPTLTVELRIDPEGTVRSVDIYESLIHSNGRLDYQQVAAYLERGEEDAIPEAMRETLRWLRTAMARLDAQRSARGGVSLLREELRVHLDDETREPTGLSTRVDNSAHRMIERLMVAANEAVACWLRERGLPALYRAHDAPDADQVAKLGEAARNFGLEAGFGQRLPPRALAAFERQLEGLPTAPALRTVLGSVLGPARYSAQPTPHFGLAAPLYLHFTSPIRRYADLVVHRVVKGYLRGERDRHTGDEALPELAEHITEASRRAAKAERERLRMLTARLFSQRIGEQMRGNVVAVRPFGLIVQLEADGVTATIPLDQLPGSRYRVDRDFALVGEQQRFVVGQPLEVVVTLADEVLGRIELALAERPTTTKRKRRPRSRGKRSGGRRSE